MARRRKASCRMVPEVPGTNEDSKMYLKLSELVKNRPLTNFIYASYLQAGVADQMDALGYRRNPQNQHSAKDVYSFFEVGSMKNLLSIKAQSKSIGFMNSSGALVDFTAEEAYNKAQMFNESNKGRVAYVVQHGDMFNILIDDKDSRTQSKQAEVGEALSLWSTLSSELTTRGIDLKELNKINPKIVNPGSVADFIRNLSTYKFVPNDGFSVKDIEMLLALNPRLPIVNNVLARGWGDRAETAQRMYDILHTSGATSSNINLVNNVLDAVKALPGFNVTDLRNNLTTSKIEFRKTDLSTQIKYKLSELDRKYGIERDVFIRNSSSITKYSEAIADAILSLHRQIRTIEAKKGRTDRSNRLRVLKDKLAEELKTKQYAAGLVDFLSTANNDLQQVNNIVNNVPTTGTGLEYASVLSEAITKAVNIKHAYYDVISAIANSDLINDFVLNDTEKETLRNLSLSLKETFDSMDKKVIDLEREAMYNIGREFIGEHNALYGKDLVDIINMNEADTSMLDYLYSIGRSSSAVISMLGAIIRDAQNNRDKELAKISLQIRREDYLLAKDGKDSSFMYDDKGRIVSQYDWDGYFKERSKYAKDLTRAGFKRNSVEFNAEMQLWEDNNTVEVIVDQQSGRTEKMPRFYLSYDFRTGWSAAQRRYYENMMKIKGQLGTLLPNYAQHHYIAPQKRTTWDQVLKEGLKKERSFKDVFDWFLENTKLAKIKEGDTRFRRNGIYVEGEESIASISDYDNTVLRQIPLFYVNKLEEKNLSHDFSSALQSLASTTFNYDAMNSIRSIAEMMTDYAARITPVDKDVTDRPLVDISYNNGLSVVVNLRKSAESSNTSSIIDSFVLKHIFGVENKSEGKLAVIGANLIGYTSLKGLAINVKGALTNKYVGVIQTMIKALGGQYYDMKDWLKAEAILLGEQGASTTGLVIGGAIGGLPGAAVGLTTGTIAGAKGMYGKFMDILTNNKNSKDSLIAEFFDQSQEVFSDLSDTRYHRTVFGKLFGAFSPMAMYQRGEYWIHMLNVYATLLHEKVVQYDPTTGKRKTISVYEALEKGEKIEGNSELKIKDNIYKLDGTKIENLSDSYFDALKRRIRYINQNCHGSMNKEDKGLLHQWMLGKMAMNFRQWMVEHYSRRFRELHWDESIRDVDLSNFYHNTEVRVNDKKTKLIDALEMVDNGLGDGSFHYEIKAGTTTLEGKALTDEILDTMLKQYAEDSGWRRGFKTDALVTFINFVKERQEYGTKANAYWNSLSETQKADVKQVMGESLMLLSLMGLAGVMGDPDDHKGEFFYRLWMYVVRRCLFDEKATTIPGAIVEAKTIINNPIASTQTVAGLLYPILGITDITETIKSGRYKGWNKYGRNVLKYTIPFYAQIDQLLNIGEESSVFSTFENQITR